MIVFDNKFYYNLWRPYTAIRWADKDVNPNTELDADWNNLHKHIYVLPSYPSAHGSASIAAMTVLANTLGTGNDYKFTMTTEEVDKAGPFSDKIKMDPPTRSFSSFSEAGMVKIPISKSKILFLVAGAFIFVIPGALFILTPDKFATTLFRNPLTIMMVGIAAVLFFGAAGIYGLRKLFDKSIGLTIDETGITDNSNASGIGLIEWLDISEIKTGQVMSTRFLLIYVNNPDKYLNRVNVFKRKLMEANMKMYGTPLSITSNTLRCSFDDLERLVKSSLIEKQRKMPSH